MVSGFCFTLSLTEWDEVKAMKKAIFGFVQFLVFLIIFAVGSLLNPFQLKWLVTHPRPLSTRDFSPGGLILVLALYLLILVIAALRNKLPAAGAVTSIALMLALIVGFLAKFGFATHELF